MRPCLWFPLAVCLLLIGCGQSKDDDVEVAETFITVERPPEPNELPREDAAAGWIKLFDGETLFGWAPPTGDWRVEEGALVSNGAAPSTLTTTTEFADYELRWEAWVGDSSAGALALRTEDAGQNGYHIQIGASEPTPPESGATAGRLPASPPNGWTKYSAIIAGGAIQATQATGADATALSGEFPAGAVAGRISLVADKGPVKIRNLYLKPSGMVPLFNSQDLSGWRDVPGGTAKFEAIVREKESRLYVHTSGGYLETEEVFDNFLLQAEVNFNGQGYDGGILFRAKDGTAEAQDHGYELQLNNETRVDDRSQPLDHGTGGLYGLVPARKQVSENFFWFVPTLVAHGNHIAVWVNGYQVTDYTDTRPPSDNPRDGSRTAAGRLSLQASGEEVDIFFKTISIVRLPSENTVETPAATEATAQNDGG